MPKEKIKEFKRKHKGKIAFAGFITAIVVIALVVSVFVFFKVEEISVSSNSQYSSEELIESSGINVGDNLFFLNSSNVEKKMLEKLSYLETVEVVKKFPFSVEIEVTLATEYYCVEYEDGYVITSQLGKVLSTSSVINADICNLLVDEVLVVGNYIEIQNEDIAEVFEEITMILSETQAGKITEMNLTDLSNITMVYESRILMDIGDILDLEGKIKFGLQLLEGGEIDADEYGTLNLKLAVEKNKAYYSETLDSGFLGEEEFENEDSSDTGESSQEESSAESEESEDESSEESSTGSTSIRGDDIPDI